MKDALIRMTWLMAVVCLLVTPKAWACSPERAVAKDNGPKDLHIYLLIGQSNMAGRATIPKEATEPLDNVYLLDTSGKWVPAKNPLNLYSTIRKGEGMQKLGPGYSFAKAMAKANPDIKIGLVVNARGGTRIEQWIGKDAKYYHAILARMKTASQSGTLKGVLWHQGESNSGKPDGYTTKLAKLVEMLRADLGDKDLPFVAGQIRDDERSKPINAEIARLPEAVHLTGYARSNKLTMYDGTHFDTKSQLELGSRYAKEMLKLLSQRQEADKPKR